MLFFFFFLTLFFIPQSAANTLRIVEAGRNGKVGPDLPTTHFCPQSFSAKGFSVVCVPTTAGASRVVFKIDGEAVKSEGMAPYAINGDIGDNIVPWNRYADGTPGILNITCVDDKGGSVSAQFSVDCSLPDTKAHSRSLPPPPNAPAPLAVQQSTATETPVGVDDKYCVTRKASQFVDDKHPDWKPVSNGGLVYKEGDTSHETDSSRQSTLRYELEVPVESTYSVVIDMTTKHETEHNDVWLGCDTGLTLRKSGSSRVMHKKANEPIKVYHNVNGRSKDSLTVDFEGYSISTKMKLKPGTNYTCTVGGRSSRTTVHGIILFPCHQKTCTYNSDHWKKYLERCHV